MIFFQTSGLKLSELSTNKILVCRPFHLQTERHIMLAQKRKLGNIFYTEARPSVLQHVISFHLIKFQMDIIKINQ